MKCWTIIKETKFLLMQLAVVLLNSFVGEDDEGVFPCCFVLATPWLDIALAQNLPITKDRLHLLGFFVIFYFYLQYQS